MYVAHRVVYLYACVGRVSPPAAARARAFATRAHLILTPPHPTPPSRTKPNRTRPRLPQTREPYNRKSPPTSAVPLGLYGRMSGTPRLARERLTRPTTGWSLGHAKTPGPSSLPGRWAFESRFERTPVLPDPCEPQHYPMGPREWGKEEGKRREGRRFRTRSRQRWRVIVREIVHFPFG